MRLSRLRRSILIVLIMLALATTACSRQADGPFEPVDGSTPTLQPTPISQSVNGTVVAGSDFSGTGATLPPLPTEESGSDAGGDALTGDLSETEEADSVAVFTLDPNAPPIFTLVASATWTTSPNTGDPLATEDVTATLSGVFITPGAPIGPVDLSGSGGDALGTDEAGGGAGALLPTPTDLLDFGNDDSDSNTADVDEECIYVVQRGDSLFSISLDLDVALDDLRAINPEVQDTDVIQVDQELIIPDCDPDVVASTAEVDEEDDTDSATALPTPSSNDDGSTGTGRTHTVAAGETLFIIAREYDVTIDAIVEANSLANPNQLDIGQVLVIPDSE
jgi:LysM repeat protein